MICRFDQVYREGSGRIDFGRFEAGSSSRPLEVRFVDLIKPTEKALGVSILVGLKLDPAPGLWRSDLSI